MRVTFSPSIHRPSAAACWASACSDILSYACKNGVGDLGMKGMTGNTTMEKNGRVVKNRAPVTSLDRYTVERKYQNRGMRGVGRAESLSRLWTETVRNQMTNKEGEKGQGREEQSTCHVFGQIPCGKADRGFKSRERGEEGNRAPVTSLDRHTVNP